MIFLAGAGDVDGLGNPHQPKAIPGAPARGIRDGRPHASKKGLGVFYRSGFSLPVVSAGITFSCTVSWVLSLMLIFSPSDSCAFMKSQVAR
jgi:hypothetical protein